METRSTTAQLEPAPPPPGPQAGLGGHDRAPHRWGGLAQPAFLVGLMGAGCAYTLIADPTTSSSGFIPCPLKAVTGLDCPTCGATRAVHALLQGDVTRAIDHNVVFVALLPLLVYLFVRWAADRVGYELPMFRWRPWMSWGLGALAIGFLVVRNLPFGPFPALAATAS